MTPRLKSLELHGYKTFASRMLFEFPGDITAIVGPNGSGKSNIADSLRWVLGEQSYSLLRGRKTEDMIFSGSEMRSRASMASATITFSNEDGWLPIDFSEISITRRAYRDGQNEYLLNGQRVRLKEIAELLGQSGLAERTYTIIGQGLVDAALSLKPEERRRFFEEAAGIGLYRSRREEALNRLDSTRRNLERVFDILGELEPRLVSLEKQARRVQEYGTIWATLRTLLRDWYGFHWRRFQLEVVHARESFLAQEGRLEQARERQAEVEVTQGEMRARLQELRGDLNRWHTQSADLHRQWEKISRGLAVMEERQRSLQSQQANLESDLSRTEEEQNDRESRMNFVLSEFGRLKTEREEAEAQANAARKDLEKRQNQRMEIEQAIRNARRLLTQMETSQVQLKAHQNELTTRVETLRKNQQSIAKTLENEAQLLQQLQTRLEKQSDQRKQAERSQKEAEEALQTHRDTVTRLEAQRKKAQEEHAKFDADRARLAAQLEVLSHAERSLSGIADGAKYLLQEAQQGHLQGGYQSLSSQLMVPAEYETAIAAALGEFLDGVIIDKADLERVFSLLAEAGKGRAILIPRSLVDKTSAKEPAQADGVIGVASRLIQAPGELRDLFSALLGQVVIVRDRSIAKEAAAQLPPGGRVITLQGEVFFSSGVMIAGVEKRTSTLGRPRRIQELQSALELSEQQAGESAARLKATDQELSGLQSAGRELETAVRQAGQMLAQSVQAHQRAVLEVEQVRQRHEFQARQRSSLDDQIQKVEQELAQGRAKVEQDNKKIAEQNDQIRGQNRALASLPVDELQAALVHWNTAVAVVGRALKDAESRQMEQREAIAAGQKRLETIHERLKETVVGLGQLESERDSQNEQETGLVEQIEIYRLQIEPAEQQLAALEKEFNELQAVMTAAQQAVTVAERHSTQAQLELSRVREAVETLRRKIEDDFGIVAFESAPEVANQAPLPLEGMVEQLPVLTDLPPEIEENISRQRALLRRLGPINFEVESEYRAVHERYEFLNNQVADLRKADEDLRKVIDELDGLMRREFRKTFDAVAVQFKQMFTRLFGGGSARLVLSDVDNPIESGIDIEARLPGRREQGLSLLSGGERSLTAVALIFALLKVSPTPFCVMDEVDAMLDEANVGRFRDLLHELSNTTQFILVTHNRNTVQAADVIYGVTMGRDSSSQVISLRLDEISDVLVQ